MRKSLSNLKKVPNEEKDKRTTKTKASAKKPNIFTISLARNKNNPNHTLFGSTKKQLSLDNRPINPFNSQQYASQKPHKTNQNNIFRNPENNILQDMNNKISIQFINSLYSDVLVQLGYQMKEKLQNTNKENHVNQANLKARPYIAINQKSKDILTEITKIIDKKQKINKYYNHMQNTHNLLLYIYQNRPQLLSDPSNQFSNPLTSLDHHNIVTNFLRYYQKQQNLFGQLEKQYSRQKSSYSIGGKKQEVNRISEEHSQQYEVEEELKKVKNQLAKENKLVQRLEREEKYLLEKLYYTQNRNMELLRSSGNLEMRNYNLRDTIRLSHSLGTKRSNEQVKNKTLLKRSLSVKLQKIRRYDFIKDEKSQTNQHQQNPNQIRTSRSLSSFNSGRVLSNNGNKHKLPPIKNKSTYFDKIH